MAALAAACVLCGHSMQCVQKRKVNHILTVHVRMLFVIHSQENTLRYQENRDKVICGCDTVIMFMHVHACSHACERLCSRLCTHSPSHHAGDWLMLLDVAGDAGPSGGRKGHLRFRV